MYQFTKKQKRTLENLGQTHIGKSFREMLDDMKSDITDITTIDSKIPVADLGIHVEARKIVKEFITDLQNGMKEHAGKRGMTIDDDE